MFLENGGTFGSAQTSKMENKFVILSSDDLDYNVPKFEIAEATEEEMATAKDQDELELMISSRYPGGIWLFTRMDCVTIIHKLSSLIKHMDEGEK